MGAKFDRRGRERERREMGEEGLPQSRSHSLLHRASASIDLLGNAFSLCVLAFSARPCEHGARCVCIGR